MTKLFTVLTLALLTTPLALARGYGEMGGMMGDFSGDFSGFGFGWLLFGVGHFVIGLLFVAAAAWIVREIWHGGSKK